jgi:hypothetical protein
LEPATCNLSQRTRTEKFVNFDHAYGSAGKWLSLLLYSADGDEPVHIHVQKGLGDGKIWLQPDIRIEYLVDFKTREEKQILEIVKGNKELIIEKWNEYFGK